MIEEGDYFYLVLAPQQKGCYLISRTNPSLWLCQLRCEDVVDEAEFGVDVFLFPTARLRIQVKRESLG